MKGAGFAVLITVVMAVSGCVQPPATSPGDLGLEAPASMSYPSLEGLVADAVTGAALPGASVTLFASEKPIVLASTDSSGFFVISVLPGATELVVEASGYASVRSSDLTSPLFFPLVAVDKPLGVVENLGLSIVRRYELGSKAYMVPSSCTASDTTPPYDCGLSEPSIEIAGDGTIYATGVCCVGDAPPIWVSRDDGVTFTELMSDTKLRETYGVEGDLAIDDDGDLFWVDISLAHAQTASWTKDGTWRHTSYQVLRPLEDRPWIRAEGNDIVYFVYNAGGATAGGYLYKSTDGGRTFPVEPNFVSSYLFPNAAVRSPGEIWLVGSPDERIIADHSVDAAASWEANETVYTMPDGQGTYGFITPAIDESGTPYVVWAEGNASIGYSIRVAHRLADGTWGPAQTVSPAGSHVMPWIAAGGPGKVAVAWYGYPNATVGPTRVTDQDAMYVYLAVSLDADSAEPHWQVIKADPQPVLTGPMARRLLDFLQVEIGPKGEVHVIYSHIPVAGGVETTAYAQSARNLPLAPVKFPAGPRI
jgi:hypothetical protein